MNAPADIRAVPPATAPALGSGAKPFSRPERLIAMRYLRARKSEGGVALIAGISFACILLAVAAMIIIMSIMNGFRAKLIELTVGAEGHIYVSTISAEPTEAELAALEERLLAGPGVVSAERVSEHPAGVQANGRISIAKIYGLEPADVAATPILVDNIVSGSLAGFGEGQGGDNRVLIGNALAASLDVDVGDRITIATGRTRTTVVGSTPVLKPYTIGGVVETGLYQTDLTSIYLSLRQAELLFNDGRLSPDIRLRLTAPDRIDEVTDWMADTLDRPVYIDTWRDRIGSLATALRTEQIAMRFIFMIVVVISTFPVLAAMIMLVKNKSRDIAILRTIGATRGAILRIFFMSGAMIGILGTLVGLAAGLLFCWQIGPIQSAIEAITGTELFPPDAYQLSGGLPVRIIWSEVAMVAVWGLLITFLATLLPSWTASRTDPVDALRYE